MRFLNMAGLALLLHCAWVCAEADDNNLSLSIGLDYSSGRYGASQKTDVWVSPISFKYSTEDWDFGVSTGWLRVTSPTFVTPDGDFTGDSTRTTRVTEAGVDDVYLAATYNLVDDEKNPYGLDTTMRVKIPTADADKFLGTGEIDYGLDFDFYKDIGNWSPFVGFGYTWRGDPADFNYNNTWAANVGSDYHVSRKLSIGLNYNWSQRSTEFAQHVQEITASLSYRLNNGYKLNFYTSKGYSNSTPDCGTGFAIQYSF